MNFKGKQTLDFITKGLSIRGTLSYNNINGFTRNLTRQDFPSYQYDPVTDTYKSLTPGFVPACLSLVWPMPTQL
jgi:hypothetical protein